MKPIKRKGFNKVFGSDQKEYLPLPAYVDSDAERERILERTNEGRPEAKARGVRFGRKPRIDNDRIRTRHGEGLGATEIARQLRIGRSTVYKILNHGA